MRLHLLLATLLLLFFCIEVTSASSLLKNLASGYDRLQHLKKAIREKIHQYGHDPNSTILYAFDPAAAALLQKKALKLERCYHDQVKGAVMSIFEQKLKVVILHYLTAYNYTHYDGKQSTQHWLEHLLHLVGNLLHKIHLFAEHIIECVRRSDEPGFLPTKVGLNRFSSMSDEEFDRRHANPLPKALGPMGKVGQSNAYSSRGQKPSYSGGSHQRKPPPPPYNSYHSHQQSKQPYRPGAYHHPPKPAAKPAHHYSKPAYHPPKPAAKPAHKPPPAAAAASAHSHRRNTGVSAFTEDYSQFEVDDIKDGDLPSALDYRKEGVISRVKDQGQSQTCFLFAAVDAIESSYMLAKRRKGVTFSVKDFYDCLPAAGVAHPELGGNVETVMALGKTRGLIDERKGDKYPENCDPSAIVKPEPKKCRAPVASSVITRVKGFAKISDLSNEKTLKKILYKYGPVSTVFRSPPKSSTSHASWSGLHGMWNELCVTGKGKAAAAVPPSHAMLLIGWVPNYWILKNSYGHYKDDNWGINGYLYLLMRNAANCGVLGSDSQIVFPSVS